MTTPAPHTHTADASSGSLHVSPFRLASLRPVKPSRTADPLDGPLFERDAFEDNPDAGARATWLMRRKHLVLAVCLSIILTGHAIDTAVSGSPEPPANEPHVSALTLAGVDALQRPFICEPADQNG